MNYIIKFLTLIIVLQSSFSCKAQIVGSILQNIITSTTETRTPLYVVIDSQLYTTGGVTFTYPVGLFPLPPAVQVSLLTGSHPMDETYTVEIQSNSAVSTTVMVCLVSTTMSGVVVNEAPNLSVTVNLLAIQQP